MIKNKKYPKIEPQFVKGDTGESVQVLLPYAVYQSIIDEINDLQVSVAKLKQQKSKNKKA